MYWLGRLPSEAGFVVSLPEMVNVPQLLRRLVFGLRFRLLVLVILACAPLVAITLRSALEDRKRSREAWEQRSLNLTVETFTAEQNAINKARTFLTETAASTPVKLYLANPADTNKAEKLKDFFYEVYAGNRDRQFGNVGIVSADGHVIASALTDRNPDHSRREYFKAVSTTSRPPFGHGPLERRSEDGLSVTFGLRIPGILRGAQREPKAVLFATMALRHPRRANMEVLDHTLPSAIWTEFNQRGDVIFEHKGEKSKGVRRFPQELIAEVFSRTNGTLEYVDLEGQTQIASFATIEGKLSRRPTATILTIPKNDLFAAADRALARNLTWLGTAVAVAMGIGWIGSRVLVLQPVQAVVKSSTRLAEGDLTARTGLSYGSDELGALTRAFDRMAHALQQREEERQKANHKLQVLSRRLVEVQEGERRHIARELHDEIGQALTAADLNLRASIEANGSTPLLPRLTASSEMIRSVLEKVQDMSLNLRPSMLDDLGLESAVRWYTTRQAELARLEAEFVSDPLDRRLDPVIETECFRIAQEALTNVVRHARATSVRVRLAAQDGCLCLSVKDDGIGFDVSALREQAVRGKSLGLLSMEERAALAGGGLELRSAPEMGTEVRAWFPLRWRDESRT